MKAKVCELTEALTSMQNINSVFQVSSKSVSKNLTVGQAILQGLALGAFIGAGKAIHFPQQNMGVSILWWLKGSLFSSSGGSSDPSKSACVQVLVLFFSPMSVGKGLCGKGGKSSSFFLCVAAMIFSLGSGLRHFIYNKHFRESFWH